LNAEELGIAPNVINE
jgi:penicillin G amidase